MLKHPLTLTVVCFIWAVWLLAHGQGARAGDVVLGLFIFLAIRAVFMRIFGVKDEEKGSEDEKSEPEASEE